MIGRIAITILWIADAIVLLCFLWERTTPFMNFIGSFVMLLILLAVWYGPLRDLIARGENHEHNTST